MDLDVTYLIQLGLFLSAVVVVNTLLLRPVLDVILLRREKIEGAQAEAARLIESGDHDRQEYQARMRTVRDAANRERERLRGEGRDQERRLLGEVRADIAKKIGDARKEIRAAEDDARLAMADDTERMAETLAAKVLGREGRA